MASVKTRYVNSNVFRKSIDRILKSGRYTMKDMHLKVRYTNQLAFRTVLLRWHIESGVPCRNLMYDYILYQVRPEITWGHSSKNATCLWKKSPDLGFLACREI